MPFTVSSNQAYTHYTHSLPDREKQQTARQINLLQRVIFALKNEIPLQLRAFYPFSTHFAFPMLFNKKPIFSGSSALRPQKLCDHHNKQPFFAIASLVRQPPCLCHF
jgi:hypothetical protein